MHTIKPTTLPFNPEHHKKLWVNIRYQTDFWDRLNTEVIHTSNLDITHDKNILSAHVWFIINALNTGQGLYVEGIEDTKQSHLVGFTISNMDIELKFEVPTAHKTTDRPSTWERERMGVW